MNPYEILGVNPSDDEETIKKAYRELVKKYHPDRYQDSPLKEQANEKLKQINQAYDMITGKQTPNNHDSGRGYYNTSSQTYNQNFTPSFQNVRTLISMGMFDAALNMLLKLEQNAQWYYLMGIIYMNKGWYQKAKECIDKACELDPSNMEYKNAQQRFFNNTTTYRTYSTNISPVAECMAGLCCLNCLCNRWYFCCC